MNALSINHGFIAVDGRDAWRAQTIVASLPRVVELLCVRDRLRLH